jgi:tetratricopeptide (TPR) repeat protein
MACVGTIRKLIGLGLIVSAAGFLQPAQSRAELVPGVNATVNDGYARLVFALGDDIDASVRTAGNVVIVTFSKPVFFSVDRLSMQAPAYIGAARRDPDGKAVRMALARKITVNSIAAGNKFFVDLLPDTWTGPPPSLPQDVVEELARRAREVERLERLAHLSEQKKKFAPVHVHVANQPTFTRYVFDVPDQVAVSADRAKERLTLTFDAPLPFDLTDAEAALPNTIGAINAEVEDESALVRFSFLTTVDLRTFRDGKGYVVDVVNADAAAPVKEKTTIKDLPNISLEVGPSTRPASESAGPGALETPAAVAEKTAPDKAVATAPPTSAQPNMPSVPAQAVPAKDEKSRAPAADEMPAPAAAKAEAANAGAKTEAPAPPPPASSHDAKSSEAKPDGMRPDAGKPDETKLTDAKVDAIKPDIVKADAAKADVAKADVAKGDVAKPDMAKADVAKADPAKGDTAKADAKATDATPDGTKPDLGVNSDNKTGDNKASENKAAGNKTAENKPVDGQPTSEKPVNDKSVNEKPLNDKPAGLIAVDIARQGANLKLSFPFPALTAAAVFQRADTLWIVFDSKLPIDLTALAGEASRTIRNAEFSREGDAAIVRLRLDHPHLSSVTAAGAGWTLTIGDTIPDPTRALDISRNMVGASRASVSIPFEAGHRLHRVRDPGVGDDLLVVTGFAPARGFINEQDFVEFHALASTQGVVIEPLADDLNVELGSDKVVIGRPGGLTLSSSLQSVLRSSSLRPVMFDAEVWGFDRQSQFDERQAQLIAAAAAVAPGKRLSQRLDLARFYIAREMYPEAKGVLDVVLAEDRPALQDVSANVLRAIAEIMMRRPSEALKDLSYPAVGDQHDAPLWRGLAFAGEGKWAQARDSFKNSEASIATLPIELQRVALRDEMRASIEVGDFGGAADDLNDIETIGLPREWQPAVSVLVGRLSEGLGRNEEALSAYRTAADSSDRPAAAQGKLREAALRYTLGDLKRDDVITELETLTTIWRGDETEIGALEILARLYTEEGRYRDSFYVMRNAVASHPESDLTRRIQDEAVATFDRLFLAGKGDALSAIDALALFYDFRELTPIGRRGDEMIRRLADRLVSVDLLDQAADLLQYQVDHRLQGAARAHVATRLAVIYLMNRKADRALATLRSSRTADLANELRNQRLLLEARAFSDLGRYDLALEVVAHLDGRETIRLRSDILWAARRWGKSAEQIELYYGDRWKDWQPLNEVERSDILRAAIGYALGEDALGLGRLREKYTAKMAKTPDARAFDVVSAPLGTSGTEFRDIARAAASIDTLDGFLRDMQARYPDVNVASPTGQQASTAASKNVPISSAPISGPAASSAAPASPASPAVRPAADAPVPPARAAGRTAQR